MAETLAQLVTLAEQIEDETTAGANTHTRVGNAIKQIPINLQEPFNIPFLDVGQNLTVAWGQSLVTLSMPGYSSIRFPQTRYAAWAWPYVTGTGRPPNNTGFQFIAQSALWTDTDDFFVDMFDQIEAAFGNLEANDGKYLHVMPALIDNLGRVIRLMPVSALIKEEA